MNISSIVLETESGEKIELSVEGARKLFDQLHEIFGQNTIYIPQTVPIPYTPQPEYIQPIITC